MQRKTLLIFITVFILVGLLMIGLYFYSKSKGANPLDTATNIYQKFNPFGTSSKVPVDPTVTETIDPTTGEIIYRSTSRFQKITEFAVAGATFFEDSRLLPLKEETTPGSLLTELVPSLKYVEKSTGHVYQMYLDTKIVGKISNSTIPGVHETIFDGRASSVIYRYLSEDDTITSFIATLGGSSIFLNSDILEISLSPDKNSFFSIIKNKNGSTGQIKSFDESKTNQVFSSPFTEWLPQWVKEKNIYLTTKPSYLVKGTVFSLDITNGTLAKILGGIPGLTTLANKDGSIILYGASLEDGPKLYIFDLKNNASQDLNTYGLPEKCIWSNDDINVYCAIPNTIVGTQYPDSWYQGLQSFDDRFIKINTLTGGITTLANSEEEVTIDATHLFLSNKEDQLFFINKKDGTLWSLSI